ncbi:hypothetical protein Bca4012_009990 [Brassica carinata]
MLRNFFFKPLAVTASFFQDQSRNGSLNQRSATKSNNNVRQISAFIIESLFNNGGMGVNYAEESTFTRESKSLDFIDYDGREDLEPKYNKSYLDLVKERRSKIRALLWKQRLLDPIVRETDLNQKIFRERNRGTIHIIAQSMLDILYNEHLMELHNQSQRFVELMWISIETTIKRRALILHYHHTPSRLKISPLNQSSATRMSRHFERTVPKRNSALNLEPIVIDAFDNSDLLAAYDLTLVGRVLNTNLQAHRVKALLALMPQAWQLEGRVQGVEVGRGKFHFRFNTEEDLRGVLEKRPFFFDQWMFPLERWVPSVRTDFLSTMIFTVFIEGIPDHYLKEQTVTGIGGKLGELISWDVKQAKVRVSVECEKPLQFERRLQFSATGDEVVISFQYEKLQKWCFICNRMTHDGKRCPELEKERAHVPKHGYNDRNLRQQDVLRGELSPYNGHGKAPKYQQAAKPTINRKLFADKEVSPKVKPGRSSDKPDAETTKAWVVKSFGNKGTSKAKEPEKKVSHDEKNENSKKKSFKQASWYREPNVELTKAASDPGKVPNRGSLSKQVPKLVTQGKENSSVCSQVMVNPADVDVDEVISPLKDLLKAKKPSERCEERGGRRGNPIKSRLGTRADAALHARKKIARSPYRDYNSRKRQAVSHDNAPKKRLFEDENQEKRDRGSIPLPPTVGPANGKKKEEPKKLVVDEIPPANPI